LQHWQATGVAGAGESALGCVPPRPRAVEKKPRQVQPPTGAKSLPWEEPGTPPAAGLCFTDAPGP
jgi:hypothetical protein